MNDEKSTRSVLRSVAVWTPTVLLGPLFVLQGLAKFPADGPWPAMFAGWGFPDRFHLVIGAVELLGGLLLLFPRVAGYAAVTLGAVMAGACLTHLVHGEWPQAGFTLLLAGAFAWLAKARLPARKAAESAATAAG